LARHPLIGLLYQPLLVDEGRCAVGGMIGRGNRSTRGKPDPVPLSSTTNATDPTAPYPGRRDGKRATNRLSYGTALVFVLVHAPSVIMFLRS
jgi:hypothetical protein